MSAVAAGSGAESDDRADAYQLAYNEAVRALSQQQSALDGFRTRAGILLSGAAIATSFLGGQALGGRPPSTWSWIAIGAFAGLGLLALAILWPRKDWEFVVSPRQLIATYVESQQPLTVPQIHRDLALHMQNSWRANDRRLGVLIWLFRGASTLLTVEVVAWIVDLAAA